MELHNVQQGSPEWLALRTQYFTASEAPAMMGVSPYMTRSELLAQKHTGLVPEVDGATQRRFDSGHETEAKFRPIAEEIIGDELYPCTGSIEIDGLRLLASFDGLTMDRKIGMEHKLLAQRIVNAILMNGEPDPEHFWQLEHQLLVSNADKFMFGTSEGTKESAVTCWYEYKPERRATLIAGWKQFAEDLKNYTAPAAAPVVVAEPVQALPAVLVQVSGEIAIKDNFKAFETALRDFLDHRLIREPKTDQDFGNLEVQIKAMKAAEEALAGAEAQMLAQVQSIDQAKKTKDMLAKLVRDNRLMAETMLKNEKERRRGEIVAGGIAALKAHINALDDRLRPILNTFSRVGVNYMPTVPADFGAAVKGLKSMTSMENAVGTELARAKIEASQIADKIELNLKWLREHATDYAFLFADIATQAAKDHDHFVAVARDRITEHKAAEARKEEETRERIRAEEERKAQAAAQAEQDRIREEAAAKARQDLINEQSAIAAATRAATPAPVLSDKAVSDRMVNEFLDAVEAKGKAQADTGSRLKLGEINSRLAPISITADGLKELGFEPIMAGAAKTYMESDYHRICEALIQRLTQVADLQPA